MTRVRTILDDAPTRRRATLNPNRYVVPVSGGKDSQLVLSLAVERYGRENVEAVHHYTGIDSKVTYEHMKWMEDFYGVHIQNTTNKKYADIWKVMDKYNAIPGRTARFCTDELKIQAFNQWLRARNDLSDLIVLMGMRAAEGQDRAQRYSGLSENDEFSLRDLQPHKVPKYLSAVRVRLPIVNMTTNQVFDMLRERGEKVNPLYAKGHTRVGCFPCVLASIRSFRLAARDPEGRETIIKLRDFKAMLVGAGMIENPQHLIPHDLDAILDHADDDPFGFNDDDDDSAGGCQWCNI
jgi:3'-phosphoadenosine 5'-phosphosulfate sulfotransferase (PAPS reductase)/FAD synthetase